MEPPMETAKIPIESLQKPSSEKKSFWIYSIRNDSDYPKATERSGKWMVFIDRNEIDSWWVRIDSAIQAGQLGSIAKVATARPNANARDPNQHVICVYSYDSSDRADVSRIRQVLRSLGVTQKIAYKTDASTREGKYRVRGHTRVSLYWE